jgi:regulatory protein
VALLLARKGIERGVADAAVARVVEDERIDPVVAAQRVAKRKLASLEGLDPRLARQRLYAYLARRGYDPDTIRSVTSSLR